MGKNTNSGYNAPTVSCRPSSDSGVKTAQGECNVKIFSTWAKVTNQMTARHWSSGLQPADRGRICQLFKSYKNYTAIWPVRCVTIIFPRAARERTHNNGCRPFAIKFPHQQHEWTSEDSSNKKQHWSTTNVAYTDRNPPTRMRRKSGSHIDRKTGHVEVLRNTKRDVWRWRRKHIILRLLKPSRLKYFA